MGLSALSPTERALIYTVKRDLGVKIFAPVYLPAKRGEIKWTAKFVDEDGLLASTASVKTCVKYGLAKWEEPNAEHPEYYLVRVKPVPAQYKKKRRGRNEGQQQDEE